VEDLKARHEAFDIALNDLSADPWSDPTKTNARRQASVSHLAKVGAVPFRVETLLSRRAFKGIGCFTILPHCISLFCDFVFLTHNLRYLVFAPVSIPGVASRNYFNKSTRLKSG